MDELGDLSDAIAWVAEKANLEDYSLDYLPKTEPDFSSFFNAYMSMQTEKMLLGQMPLFYQSKDIIPRLLGLYPLQARAFVDVRPAARSIPPRRAAARCAARPAAPRTGSTSSTALTTARARSATATPASGTWSAQSWMRWTSIRR